MFEKFGFGSYRIDDNESNEQTSSKKSNLKLNAVLVHFLDGSSQKFEVDKKTKGCDVLKQVFDHLNLTERDYFGLKICKTDYERWLDPTKNFRNQWIKEQKGCGQNPAQPTLHFRVKFFSADPTRLHEYTRYLYFLQIKHDIWHGRLPVPPSTSCLLASFQVQSELGDFNADEHREGYLGDLQLMPNQTEDAERQIAELHKLHRGQMPADAECKFLEHAKRLDQYGVDFHDATDSSEKEIRLGVCELGLLVYANDLRINTFSWSKMTKVSFKRKEFFIQLRREPAEDYDTLLGFNVASHKRAKILWQSCVEHHSFFRLQKPHHRPNYFASFLGSKFRYSGRTAVQALKDQNGAAKSTGPFARSPGRRTIQVFGDSKSPRLAWPSKKPAASSDGEGSSSEILEPAGEVSEKFLEERGLMAVRLYADEQGRYGFSVKGGKDLHMPIYVSRVVANTPAHNSKIRENDQVIMINGRTVSNLTHDQVVSLIRNSRFVNDGQFNLVIKPDAFKGVKEEEPLIVYVPEDETGGAEANLFKQSLLLLSDSIASGALLQQYEQLYRRNNDLAITEAFKLENVSKNRYRDISPYDCTRVILLGNEDGDYINANYVNMEIPNGTINRYIASQGPLPNTVKDFWRMVQQESSHLIVMLTTILERGRVKCHQYWPECDEVLDMDDGFVVKCLSEAPDPTGSFVDRIILLSDEKTGESRTIQHLQYLAWPDHGVPSDPKLFLDFTNKVRMARSRTLLHEIEETLKQVRLKDADENDGLDVERKTTESGESPCDLPPTTSVHQCISAANPPVIIHCSAGIGRTGVLILMDTALTLIEIKEPVYPLDIVQAMRDQRASMVQNVGQYKFVCECIVAAFNKMTKQEEESQQLTANK